MLVRDVMQSPVQTVPAAAPLVEAVAAMIDHGVDCVDATETNPARKVGVLTETDVLVAMSMTDGFYAASGRPRRHHRRPPRHRPRRRTRRDHRPRRRSPTNRPRRPHPHPSRRPLRIRQESVTHLVVSEQLTLKGTLAPADIGRHLDDIIYATRTSNARQPNWSRNS